jgi:hypothetical protein
LAGFLYFLAGFFFVVFFFSAAKAPSEAIMAAAGRTVVAANAAITAAMMILTGRLHGKVADSPTRHCSGRATIGAIPEIAPSITASVSGKSGRGYELAPRPENFRHDAGLALQRLACVA